MTKENKFIAQETITTVGNGSWIVLNESNKDFVARLVVNSGTGKIQYTLDNLSAISNDTAEAIDWSKGVLSASDDSIFSNATAVRGVLSAAGAITIKVVQ